MNKIVIEIPIAYVNGETDKIYIKGFIDRDFGDGNTIAEIDRPRILSDKEREEIGL